MPNRGFDGSSVSLFGATLSPLTGAHAEDRPASVRTSGADADTHTAVPGRNNVSLTIDVLSSRLAVPGSIGAIVATYKDGTAYNYAVAAITRTRVSGRRDGDITGSITIRPSGADATNTTIANATGDCSFDGSTFSFNASPLTGIVSATYDASAAEVDDTGAEANAVLVTPGIPDETLTVQVLGGATLVKGAAGNTAVAWHDGGTLGTFASAVVMEVRDGGNVDGDITTEYVFKRKAT